MLKRLSKFVKSIISFLEDGGSVEAKILENLPVVPRTYHVPALAPVYLQRA